MIDEDPERNHVNELVMDPAKSLRVNHDQNLLLAILVVDDLLPNLDHH